LFLLPTKRSIFKKTSKVIEIREGSIEEIYYAIDTAEKLGASVVTLHPALEPYGLKIEERREIELDSNFNNKKGIKLPRNVNYKKIC